MIKGFLYSLSGDDFTLIRKVSRPTQIRFISIGILVAIITISSFIGSLIMFLNLIGSWFTTILLAVFFSWLVTNMYLLTLYTFSKSLLPNKEKKISSGFSTLGKIGFLSFLGLIISTPFSVLIFKNKLDPTIAQYKEQQIAEYQALSNQYLKSDSLLISNLAMKSESPKESSFFSNYLIDMKNEKARSDTQMRNLVRRSSFYTRSITILHKDHPEHWFFSAFFILIFISPVLIKRYTSILNEYYQKKKETEMLLIEEEYVNFKKAYAIMFQKFGNPAIEWRENHIDPPYNTKKKPEHIPQLLDQEILRKKLYHG